MTLPSPRPPSPARWVVYSTFDAEGVSSPFVVEQLLAYRQLGFETLVVDTSPTLSAAREAAWNESASAWLRRDNIGYDIGSYAAGLRFLAEERNLLPPQLDVLLTNDSCYGPYTPLDEIFDSFESAPRDGRRVFALTDSSERGHHLQSYWLYFRADVLPIATAYLATIAPRIADREDAVAHGELGLSRHLLSEGCELIAYRPLQAVVKQFATFRGRLLSFVELVIRWKLNRPRYTRHGDRACLNFLLNRPYTCNQTIAFGTYMYFEGLTPFIKRQLVRENPNFDHFIPPTPPSDSRDNAAVERWLKGSQLYRRRYGHPRSK